EVTGAIHRKSERLIQLGLSGRAIVSREARRPNSSHGGDDPIRADLPHPAAELFAEAVGFGNIEVAQRIDGQTVREIQLRLSCWPAIARRTLLPRSSHGGHG